VTSSDAPAGDYGIGETTGVFSFLAYSAGTYHFTITAANGVSPDATQSFTITVTDGDTPLSDYQQWLQDHGVATDMPATDMASNGHTYWDNYIADIDPASTDFLEVSFTAAADGTFTITPHSDNRDYQLLYYTDLNGEPTRIVLDDPEAFALPLDATGFGRILVTLPSSP
jgi:hypothetical protein